MQNLSCSTRCDIGSPVDADEDSPYSCWPVYPELLCNFAGEGETPTKCKQRNKYKLMKREVTYAYPNLPHS